MASIVQINSYALALLSLAKEDNNLTKFNADVSKMIFAFEQNESYLQVLNSPEVLQLTKEKLIKQAFSKQVSQVLYNFLLLLAKKSRLTLAMPILIKLRRFINDTLSIKEGILYSSQKISQLELQRIERRVAKQLGSPIVLSPRIDAELLMGMRIEIDDQVIEDSAKSRLGQIKDRLLKKEH